VGQRREHARSADGGRGATEAAHMEGRGGVAPVRMTAGLLGYMNRVQEGDLG
jgi:hypothetical protein